MLHTINLFLTHPKMGRVHDIELRFINSSIGMGEPKICLILFNSKIPRFTWILATFPMGYLFILGGIGLTKWAVVTNVCVLTLQLFVPDGWLLTFSYTFILDNCLLPVLCYNPLLTTTYKCFIIFACDSWL